MKRSALLATIVALFMIASIATVGKADFQFSIVNPTGGPTGGTFVLPPSTSTPVQIFLNSTDASQTIGSLKFRISIGDGAGLALEPSIVGITPGVSFGVGSGYAPGGGQPQFDATRSQLIFDLTNTSTPIGFAGNQLVATVSLNTSAFAGQGPFNFLLSNSFGGSSVTDTIGTSFNNTVLSGGTFSVTAVPEPSSMALLGLVGVGTVALRRFRKKSKV